METYSLSGMFKSLAPRVLAHADVGTYDPRTQSALTALYILLKSGLNTNSDRYFPTEEYAINILAGLGQAIVKYIESKKGLETFEAKGPIRTRLRQKSLDETFKESGSKIESYLADWDEKFEAKQLVDYLETHYINSEEVEEPEKSWSERIRDKWWSISINFINKIDEEIEKRQQNISIQIKSKNPAKKLIEKIKNKSFFAAKDVLDTFGYKENTSLSASEKAKDKEQYTQGRAKFVHLLDSKKTKEERDRDEQLYYNQVFATQISNGWDAFLFGSAEKQGEAIDFLYQLGDQFRGPVEEQMDILESIPEAGKSLAVHTEMVNVLLGLDQRPKTILQETLIELAKGVSIEETALPILEKISTPDMQTRVLALLDKNNKQQKKLHDTVVRFSKDADQLIEIFFGSDLENPRSMLKAMNAIPSGMALKSAHDILQKWPQPNFSKALLKRVEKSLAKIRTNHSFDKIAPVLNTEYTWAKFTQALEARTKTLADLSQDRIEIENLKSKLADVGRSEYQDHALKTLAYDAAFWLAKYPSKDMRESLVNVLAAHVAENGSTQAGFLAKPWDTFQRYLTELSPVIDTLRRLPSEENTASDMAAFTRAVPDEDRQNSVLSGWAQAYHQSNEDPSQEITQEDEFKAARLKKVTSFVHNFYAMRKVAKDISSHQEEMARNPGMLSDYVVKYFDVIKNYQEPLRVLAGSESQKVLDKLFALHQRVSQAIDALQSPKFPEAVLRDLFIEDQFPRAFLISQPTTNSEHILSLRRLEKVARQVNEIRQDLSEASLVQVALGHYDSRPAFRRDVHQSLLRYFPDEEIRQIIKYQEAFAVVRHNVETNPELAVTSLYEIFPGKDHAAVLDKLTSLMPNKMPAVRAFHDQIKTDMNSIVAEKTSFDLATKLFFINDNHMVPLLAGLKHHFNLVALNDAVLRLEDLRRIVNYSAPEQIYTDAVTMIKAGGGSDVDRMSIFLEKTAPHLKATFDTEIALQRSLNSYTAEYISTGAKENLTAMALELYQADPAEQQHLWDGLVRRNGSQAEYESLQEWQNEFSFLVQHSGDTGQTLCNIYQHCETADLSDQALEKLSRDDLMEAHDRIKRLADSFLLSAQSTADVLCLADILRYYPSLQTAFSVLGEKSGISPSSLKAIEEAREDLNKLEEGIKDPSQVSSAAEVFYRKYVYEKEQKAESIYAALDKELQFITYSDWSKINYMAQLGRAVEKSISEKSKEILTLTTAIYHPNRRIQEKFKISLGQWLTNPDVSIKVTEAFGQLDDIFGKMLSDLPKYKEDAQILEKWLSFTLENFSTEEAQYSVLKRFKGFVYDKYHDSKELQEIAKNFCEDFLILRSQGKSILKKLQNANFEEALILALNECHASQGKNRAILSVMEVCSPTPAISRTSFAQGMNTFQALLEDISGNEKGPEKTALDFLGKIQDPMALEVTADKLNEWGYKETLSPPEKAKKVAQALYDISWVVRALEKEKASHATIRQITKVDGDEITCREKILKALENDPSTIREFGQKILGEASEDVRKRLGRIISINRHAQTTPAPTVKEARLG